MSHHTWHLPLITLQVQAKTIASEAVQTIRSASTQEFLLATTVDNVAVLVAIHLNVSSSSWSDPIAAVSVVVLIPCWLWCWSYSVVPIPRWLWRWSDSVVLVVAASVPLLIGLTGRLWSRPDTGRPHR